MIMSTRVVLLISAVPLFEREYTRSLDPVFLLPKKLQELISQVYDVPLEDCEGPEVRKMYTPDGMLKQQGKRYRTVSEYVAMCRDVFRGDNVQGKQLNRRNVHRAIELCVLTIPSFVHGRNCSEMILEATHRTFKRWLETNTHADARITGVERTLLKDWLNRVHGLYLQWSNGDEEQRIRAERGLLRLFFRYRCIEDGHGQDGSGRVHGAAQESNGGCSQVTCTGGDVNH